MLHHLSPYLYLRQSILCEDKKSQQTTCVTVNGYFPNISSQLIFCVQVQLHWILSPIQTAQFEDVTGKSSFSLFLSTLSCLKMALYMTFELLIMNT